MPGPVSDQDAAGLQCRIQDCNRPEILINTSQQFFTQKVNPHNGLLSLHTCRSDPACCSERSEVRWCGSMVAGHGTGVRSHGAQDIPLPAAPKCMLRDDWSAPVSECTLSAHTPHQSPLTKDLIRTEKHF